MPCYFLNKNSVSNIRTPYHFKCLGASHKTDSRGLLHQWNVRTYLALLNLLLQELEKNISENRTNIKKDIRFGVEVLPCQYTQYQRLILMQERPARSGPQKVFTVLNIPTRNIVHAIRIVKQITQHYIISATLFTLFYAEYNE